MVAILAGCSAINVGDVCEAKILTCKVWNGVEREQTKFL